MDDHKYWAEQHRDGEIDVVCGSDYMGWHAILQSGKAVQFYELNYKTATERHSKEFPEADLWYTERNGDPITMLVPKGTDTSILPSVAMDYIAFEWIKHDGKFGSGVKKRRLKD